jgi:endonuclease YncB( thermonuclease family)
MGALTASPWLLAQTYAARAVAVPDGDTLWVEPQTGGPARKLRLQGVDAPEICQAGGPASRDALRALVEQRMLSVTVRYQDDYGRDLARIEADGQDLAAAMVRQGQAWSYRWRRSPGPYAAEEALAREARLGLFAEPAPELPRDFRQRHGSCYLPDELGGFRLKEPNRTPGSPAGAGVAPR